MGSYEMEPKGRSLARLTRDAVCHVLDFLFRHVVQESQIKELSPLQVLLKRDHSLLRLTRLDERCGSLWKFPPLVEPVTVHFDHSLRSTLSTMDRASRT